MSDIVERLELVIRGHVIGAMPIDGREPPLRSLSLSTLLIEYRTWRGRFVAPQPRAVQISAELQGSPMVRAYEHEFATLRRKIEAGEDLTPHLSTRIHRPFENIRAPSLEHRTDRDSLLAEWGVHHLHLSKRRRGGTARRGDDVLLAAFTGDVAYLIDIRAHPRHANWVQEFGGVRGGKPYPSLVDPEEIRRLLASQAAERRLRGVPTIRLPRQW